jgi:DNA-binding NarL/FixJ family response regulator
MTISADTLDVKLSRREKQVAELIQRGLTDKQIALELGLSKHTINHYTKSAFKKLGIHKRSAVGSALNSPAPTEEKAA